MSTPHARRYLAVAALSVAGLTAGCATPLASPLGAPATSAPSVSPTFPPSSAPPINPTHTTNPPAGPTSCTATMLAYDSKRAEGAMGTAYSTFTFHNSGSVSCRVDGPPGLTYVDSHGATLPVPVNHDAAGGEVVVTPGSKVQFVSHEVNGYGGYAPGAPECAHPATYNHVVVVLPGGSVSLGADGTWSVQCGMITVGSWAPPGP